MRGKGGSNGRQRLRNGIVGGWEEEQEWDDKGNDRGEVEWQVDSDGNREGK